MIKIIIEVKDGEVVYSGSTHPDLTEVTIVLHDKIHSKMKDKELDCLLLPDTLEEITDFDGHIKDIRASTNARIDYLQPIKK